LDLVPQVLEQLDVKRVFHKVYLKPGKPLWFGICDSGPRKTLVFGLPGNPVGSLVCFELFVAPVLRKMRGFREVRPVLRSATLTVDHCHQSDRPTYFPALARYVDDGRLVATPLAWEGSADQRAMGSANCLAFFPPGAHAFSSGDPVQLLLLGPCLSG
jgi:molybdopterin molybdotransferase